MADDPKWDDESEARPSATGELFLHRPSLGIRTRLSLGFLSLFLVGVAVTVAAHLMLSRLDVRLRFLEGADRYTMEIQQARRFEKNYFLYDSVGHHCQLSGPTDVGATHPPRGRCPQDCPG
jgi:hypothetical protein